MPVDCICSHDPGYAADVRAAAETYMGLVEVGVGLVPGAGGCKELVRRLVSPAMQIANADPLPVIQQALQTIDHGETLPGTVNRWPDLHLHVPTGID